MTCRPHNTTGAEAVARWTDLVIETERAAASPTRSTEKLERACAWARKAEIPAGELTRDNPFIRLLDTAHGYAVALTARRPAMAGDVIRALEAAAELRALGVGVRPDKAETPAPPSRPFRRDIDG